MLVIGLTGGIASGKTTISDYFASLGIGIIDTDIVSRKLLEPGKSGFEEVVKKLGDSILQDNGEIDRQELRRRVFDNRPLKTWLESILHPLIYEAVLERINNIDNSPYVLVVVPLLFESHFESMVDRVLVVDCPRKVQLERLINRDNIDELLANKMLDQQMSNEERLIRADDVIQNEGDSNLERQISRLHRQYLEIT